MPPNPSSALCLAVIYSMLLVAPVTSKQEDRPRGHALLVGTDIYKNYPRRPTPGAEADVRETTALLIEKYGFQSSEIKVLLREQATAQNIRDAFRSWLIQGTRPGERVFFYYSGHGKTVDDVDGDEAQRTPGDTKDEALAPYDVSADSPESVIIDDELSVMINQLSGRMALLVFDSCFSGTISRGSSAGPPNSEPAIARYLPSPREIEDLAQRGGTGVVDDYVVLPQKGVRI